MILGVGIDIVEIRRIERAVGRFGNRFLNKVYHPGELKWCNRRANPFPCLAGRFAVKEAFVKALGTGFRGGISMTDIYTQVNEAGAPAVELGGQALLVSRDRGVKSCVVSISHDAGVAVAVVILQG